MTRRLAGSICQLCLIAALFLLSAASARAQLTVDITQGSVEPLPIAVTEFVGETEQEVAFGRDIANVIAGDLERPPHPHP